jgi:hypothetical protein
VTWFKAGARHDARDPSRTTVNRRPDLFIGESNESLSPVFEGTSHSHGAANARSASAGGGVASGSGLPSCARQCVDHQARRFPNRHEVYFAENGLDGKKIRSFDIEQARYVAFRFFLRRERDPEPHVLWPIFRLEPRRLNHLPYVPDALCQEHPLKGRRAANQLP